jgi:hypothetical protein
MFISLPAAARFSRVRRPARLSVAPVGPVAPSRPTLPPPAAFSVIFAVPAPFGF